MRKILIISYPFPPIPYSGTYRILRLCKGLSKLGVEVFALSIRINQYIPNDFDLLSRIPEPVAVYRTGIFDPWLRYQAWRKRHPGLFELKYFNKIMSLFFRLITLPDHQIFWIPFAVLKGIKIIKRHNIHAIFVSSPPNSSHLIGYFLKKFSKVKWLADFRDPIVGNIAQTHLINPKDILSKLERRILIRLEKLVINNADAVIANTETHRKALEHNFGGKKFHTLRNCFDQDDYNGVDAKKFDKFTIAHLGSFYGLRKADVLFMAIKRLEEKYPKNIMNLQILFVGLNDPSLSRTIQKYGVEKYIKIRGMVNHNEAIRIMLQSHLLLLIKAIGDSSNGQIPAKFFEYVGTGNKILYIGPKNSEVAEIIKHTNSGYVIENEDDMLADLLKRHLNSFSKNATENVPDRLFNEFEIEHTANKLNALLQRQVG